ncbi:hypothetical protein [Novosphingobium sp. ST904]|uniref:hypothetical protein n=1 Tax=Novosphingobium sp. ST904 TaxID=1684385 RepID=UPI0006C88671|nr:hypothetical protein [Novosphingobium sp. ST904]KPH69289.1 hypothetical protein ADT71_00490 [Novosphingobium sp. ST904]TCM19055.1 hypothetical protein EDF59_1781 [Novosphingobium sp. ST904]
MRDTAGKVFIPNYTFRPTDDPNFTLFNMRVKGRIHDGVVMTDTIPKFDANLGQDPLLELFKARIRLEPQPDGTMKGILGGYRDWRRIAEGNGSGYSEGLFGYQAPAVYYALQREADGLQNPVTGEYDGISVAYEIDTVPAFMTKESPSDMAMADKALADNAHARSSKKGDVR